MINYSTIYSDIEFANRSYLFIWGEPQTPLAAMYLP